MSDADARLRAAEEWEAKLQTARSVAEIMVVEGRAAAAYWRCFKDAGLRERKNGNLPRSWMRFAQRGKGNAFFGPKHAAHPINAMLNYCYVVEAGRLAKALAAQGLALPIGYLHSDKKGRNSLVWDAIEPLRPCNRRQGLRIRRGARIRAARLSAVRLQRASPFAGRDAIALASASLPSRDIEERGGVDGEDGNPAGQLAASGLVRARRNLPARLPISVH